MNGKTRISVLGANQDDLRKICQIEIKDSQIVAAFNQDGKPIHMTKHQSGVLHVKEDRTGDVLWERVGQPLQELTSSESLGTFSIDISRYNSLPRFRSGGSDQFVTIPLSQERAEVEVVVQVVPEGDHDSLSSSMTYLAKEGFQTSVPTKAPMVIVATRQKESSKI